jgi:parallel beta-helix repeat protein
VVAWIKRSRGGKAESPPAAQPPSRTSPPGQQPQPPPAGAGREVPAVHLVYGLRAGMDRATVIDRLGPPPKSLTDKELFAGYRNVVGAKPAGKEFWLYEDAPPGHDIHVVIADGVLESVDVLSQSAGDDPKDSPSSAGKRKRKVRIAKDSRLASTPVHAVKMLAAILLDETPLADSARMRAGYEDVRRQSWREAPLDVGPVPEIIDLLQADLEHDAMLPNHVDFMLVSMPDRACAQVASVFDVPGESYGLAIAYRVWLIDGGRQMAMARSKPRGSPSFAPPADKAAPKEAGDAGQERPTRVVGGQDGGYTTIGEAIRGAALGSRIVVRPGLYHEAIVVDKPLELIGDGAPGDVVIESSDAPALLFRADTGRVAHLTLCGTGSDSRIKTVDIMQGRLELEDCDITSRGSSCVVVHNGADPRLRRNRIHDGKQAGVLSLDNSLGTLEENDIHSNSNTGVAIAGGANPTLRGNRIHSGRASGVWVYDQGLGVLEDNDITGNTLAGVEIGKGGSPTVRGNKIRDGKQSGVYVHDQGLGVLEDNDITGNTLAGVEISTGGSPTVRGNTISRNGGSAIRIYDEGRATASRNRLQGNAGGAWNISSECEPHVAREDNED